tara:strand:+ start:963 stop:1145 length:183 start_codon:yes stop_codon:yes gene_type:complete
MTKKFDYRTELKNLNIEQCEAQIEYNLNMWTKSFDEESEHKYLRNVDYLRVRIAKLEKGV